MKCTCKSTTHGHKAGECRGSGEGRRLPGVRRSRTESETVGVKNNERGEPREEPALPFVDQLIAC